MQFKKFSLIFAVVFLIIAFTASTLSADELYPLYPKVVKNLDKSKNQLTKPPDPWTDQYYWLTHTDDYAEYYLSSGAAGDTFFIVFQPLAACTVEYVEIQWFDAGNVNAFAALYSDAASIAFPLGQAPERGTTDISPIGDWLTGQVPNTASGIQDWEDLDIGPGFVVGNPISGQPDMFGVGFIKGDALPHPLADGVSAYGIHYSYTWFGGPWTLPPAYPHVWGSYSSDFTGTVIEVMMRAWVHYIGPMPIMISDVSHQCDTYNLTGPFPVTCTLVDDNGITGADIIQLQYNINGGPTISIPLIDIPPTGDDIYGADISGNFSVGDFISYWIYTIDDGGLVNSTALTPQSFLILEPDNPDAELLFVDEDLDEYEMTAWEEVLAGVDVEFWSTVEHDGIDESVVNWGWDKVFVAGWGCSTVPALEEENAYSEFLDTGGNLFYTDQDYFYANNLPTTGTFVPGDFAHDYFGLGDYWNDPSEEVDTSFYGLNGDPISGDFESVSYWTQYEDPGWIWCDYFNTSGATEIFFGDEYDHTYGASYETNFKTVYLGFNAWFGCDIDPNGYYHANDQFITLIGNILEWFEEDPMSITMTPLNPPIIVPAGGGSFEFNIAVANNTGAPQTLDLWTVIMLPGVGYVPVLNLDNFTFPPVTIDRDRNQAVPGHAPAGEYTYYGYLGDYPWVVDHFDSFTFVKEGGDEGGSLGSPADWICTGEPFVTEASAASNLPESYALNPAHPNPFNPETTISFDLPEAGQVSLVIYDVQGREVARLADGFYPAGGHQLSFDGSDLSSGIYFVRMVSGNFYQTQKLLLIK